MTRRTDDKSTQTRTCPECGAPLVHALDCRGQLGAIMAWEWQDPELMAQHFLTIASYNLQHPAQFTAEALAGLREQFIDHLDNGVPIQEIRRRVSSLAEGNTKVLIPAADRHPVLHHWPMSIADVYLPDQPAGAADRVKAWAASIRTELRRG